MEQPDTFKEFVWKSPQAFKDICKVAFDTTGQIPWIYRGVFFLALLYVLMPLDAVPDLIPFAGWVDDLLVMFAVLMRFGSEVTTTGD